MTTNPPTPRALDAQIAERVMGWTEIRLAHPIGGALAPEPPCGRAPDGYRSLPHYSTSTADSRLVLERMRELGWGVIICGQRHKWRVEFLEPLRGHVCATHESLDMAICIAALEAVGQGDKETL